MAFELSEIQSAWKAGSLKQDSPEIVAIFEQIKNLRESDRSLRSLRRTMELDNVPDLELEVEAEAPPAPEAELTQLLEAFVTLRKEKIQIETKLGRLLETVSRLEETVERQAREIADLKK